MGVVFSFRDTARRGGAAPTVGAAFMGMASQVACQIAGVCEHMLPIHLCTAEFAAYRPDRACGWRPQRHRGCDAAVNPDPPTTVHV